MHLTGNTFDLLFPVWAHVVLFMTFEKANAAGNVVAAHGAVILIPSLVIIMF